jgi:hypothetical protein
LTLKTAANRSEPEYDLRRLIALPDELESAMNDKLFHLIAGTIFALVALLQALRLYMGWTVVIGGWTAPMWISWIAIVVAGGLSYFALTLKSHS